MQNYNVYKKKKILISSSWIVFAYHLQKGFTSALQFQRDEKQTEQMERLLKKHKGCDGTKVTFNKKKLDPGVQNPKIIWVSQQRICFLPWKVKPKQFF